MWLTFTIILHDQTPYLREIKRETESRKVRQRTPIIFIQQKRILTITDTEEKEKEKKTRKKQEKGTNISEFNIYHIPVSANQLR